VPRVLIRLLERFAEGEERGAGGGMVQGTQGGDDVEVGELGDWAAGGKGEG
jgi:hypothetical protein